MQISRDRSVHPSMDFFLKKTTTSYLTSTWVERNQPNSLVVRDEEKNCCHNSLAWAQGGKKTHNEARIPRAITELNNPLLRQLTRKFCHLKYSITMTHWGCKMSKTVNVYLLSVSTHQAALCSIFIYWFIYFACSLPHLTTSCLARTASAKFIGWRPPRKTEGKVQSKVQYSQM